MERELFQQNVEMQNSESLHSNKLNQVASNFSEILEKSHEISVDEILKKICVSPPYFAFKKIYQFEDVLIAPIEREQQMGNEASQMTVGEICRHLAILGTCSASLTQTEKFYYLAKIGMANLVEKTSVNPDPGKRQLYAVMQCKGSDKRTANSKGFLINSSEEKIVANVDVSYEKIADKLFKKFFNSHFQLTKDYATNPYSKTIEFENVEMKNDQLTATIPKIPNEYCAGHFDGCPAIPIAYSAYNITRYVGELFYQITGQKKYIISEANLLSSNLPFPDETLDLKINYNGLKNNFHKFLCLTVQGVKNISSLEVSIVKSS